MCIDDVNITPTSFGVGGQKKKSIAASERAGPWCAGGLGELGLVQLFPPMGPAAGSVLRLSMSFSPWIPSEPSCRLSRSCLPWSEPPPRASVRVV